MSNKTQYSKSFLKNQTKVRKKKFTLSKDKEERAKVSSSSFSNLLSTPGHFFFAISICSKLKKKSRVIERPLLSF